MNLLKENIIMLRTKAVKLTTIPAMAFRAKLPGGPSITIQRSDYEQPGIASISRTSGEAIPAANINTKVFPPEAFKEAIELTSGLPYNRTKEKKQKGIKVTKEMTKEEKEVVEEEIVIDSEEYQKILDKYEDKNGKLSYDLINKDFIKFAKSSSIVRDMAAEGATAKKIHNYVVTNKIRNITGNQDLSDKQVKKMVELLDETYPKGIFKELDSEIRKMVKTNKRK